MLNINIGFVGPTKSGKTAAYSAATPYGSLGSYNKTPAHYRPSGNLYGAFSVKNPHTNPPTPDYKIWDINLNPDGTTDERFLSHLHGIIIVYDSTSPSREADVRAWIKRVKENAPNAAVYVMENQFTSDACSDPMQTANMQLVCENLGVGFFSVDLKERYNKVYRVVDQIKAEIEEHASQEAQADEKPRACM